jgi:hypothetical protein
MMMPSPADHPFSPSPPSQTLRYDFAGVFALAKSSGLGFGLRVASSAIILKVAGDRKRGGRRHEASVSQSGCAFGLPSWDASASDGLPAQQGEGHLVVLFLIFIID